MVRGRGRLTAEPRTEKAYEKHAWIIFTVIGLYFLILSTLILGFGASPQDADVSAITGMTWDGVVAANANVARLVTYEFQQKELGTIIWASSVVAIAAYPFRRAEKWAWFYLWSVPIHFGILGAFFLSQLGQVGQGQLGFFVVLILISVIGLLLPYRKFFPRTRVAPS